VAESPEDTIQDMLVDQEYMTIDISEDNDPLKEHPENPNVGDEAVLEESISVNGFYGAIIVQKSTDYIIAGNHRYRIAKRRGLPEIPAIVVDVDDVTAKKIMAVDNESTRKGKDDKAKLEELLSSLPSLDGTGHILASAQETIEKESTPSASADDDGDGDPEVPEDEYTPEFGIMISCETAVQQKTRYDWLKRNAPDWDVKVVAV
jgi:ParB-like chromosome segregation protein Spo0J